MPGVPNQRLYHYQQVNSFCSFSLICTTKCAPSKRHKQMHVCLSQANIQSIRNRRPWLQQLLTLSGSSFRLSKQFQSRWHICHQADFREEPWMLRQRVTSIQMNPQEKTSWNVELIVMSLSRPSRKHRWQLALLSETM